MIRMLLAAALAVAPVALPTVANAQSCSPIPGPQHCLNRFPPGQTIDNRVGAVGTVSCEAVAANSVQYDVYVLSGAGYTYQCTQVLTCAQIQTTDPQAYAKFC